MSSASRPETALENSPLDNHFERVGEDVACGGGAMFKAREKSSGKVVGIQRPPSDPVAIERFVAAAVRVKRLWHTHLLRHYVVAKDDRGPYCAFEWCDGGSVQSKLSAGPLSETEVWALARAVASALEYAHQQGIAHLNVRPSSILVAQTLNYKLGGFGEFSIGAPQDHEHDDVYAPGTIGSDSAALERRDIVDLGLTLLHVATAQAPRPAVIDELLAKQKPNLADFVQRCVDRTRGDAFKSIEEAMRSIRENTSGGTEVAGTGRRNAPSPGTSGMRKLLSPERPLGMSGRIPLDGPTAPMPGARPNDDVTVRGRSSATRGTNPTAGSTPVTGSGSAGSARRGGSGSPLPFESMTERYEEIGDRLEGGMGYVMKCRETSTGRIVAVKRVKSIPGQDEMLVQRFLREANNIARLSHPHVLTLFRAARDDEGDYIVLEWADGGSLKDRLNMAGKLPLNEVLDVARKIGGALGYAHSKGVIHRDIKPHNILLMEDGTPKLADFGLARGTGDMTITRSTGGAGTPIYMAPEQWISARDADGRSDLCSFGKVLYHLSTGQSPVKFIPSKLPFELRSTISILVKDRREDRFQTAEQFLNHMERSLKRVRFLKTLGILLAVLAILFVVAMFVPAERAPFLKPMQDAVRGLFHK